MAELRKKEKTEAKFTKRAVLNSSVYSKYRDILETVLEDGKAYTRAEIEKKIDDFKKE